MGPIRFEFNGFNKDLVEQLCSRIAEALKEYEFDSFLVGCTFEDYLSDEGKEILRKEFQPLVVKRLEELLKKKADYSKPQIDILINFNQDLVYFLVHSVYVTGRYRKYAKLYQTRHYCYRCKGRGCDFCKQKGVLSNESVEELIAKYLVPAFEALSAKFHGAGREDADVRMLGPGREFVMQIIEPKKRKVDLRHIEKEINEKEAGKIEVIGLSFCEKETIAKIKAKKSRKVYAATVKCENLPDEAKVVGLLGQYVVAQRTPTRVLRRRANILRYRKVEIKKAFIENGFLKLEMIADSGLYIKEFISGDSGRTDPSISKMLQQNCECVELDVVDIIE
ncbi:MAG: tRNA pseudouridine(54/55) synthase Pus10 [Candidatus Diapherotrites archaeon]